MSILLNGTDEYLEGDSNESSFDIDRTDPFSFSVWLTADTKNRFIFSKAPTGGAFEGIHIFNHTAGGQVSFYLINNFGGDNYLFTASTNSVAPDGNWHHVLVTHDGSGHTDGVEIYIDGVKETQQSQHNTLTGSILNNIEIQLGARNAASFHDGQLSDAAFWDIELTEANVKSIWNSRQKHMPLQINPSNLIAYWPLDDKSDGTDVTDDTLRDMSGNGNGILVKNGGIMRAEEYLSYPGQIIIPSSLGVLLKVANETLQINESTIRLGNSTRLKNETVQINEGTIRLGNSTRLKNETVQVNEGILRKLVSNRIIAETLNWGENILRKLDSIRIISETIQFTEDLIRKCVSTRITNESISINEGILKFTGIFKLVNETVQWGEDILRKLVSIRIISETIQWGEDKLRKLNSIRIISETIQFAENSIRKCVSNRIVNETIGINESTLRFSGIFKLVSETVQWGEGILRKLVSNRIISETLQWSESVLRKLASIRIIAENLNWNENSLYLRGIKRIINETFQWGEGIVKKLAVTGIAVIKVINETVQFAEGLIRKAASIRIIDESLSWIESLLKSSWLYLFKPQMKILKDMPQMKSLKGRKFMKWIR